LTKQPDECCTDRTMQSENPQPGDSSCQQSVSSASSASPGSAQNNNDWQEEIGAEQIGGYDNTRIDQQTGAQQTNTARHAGPMPVSQNHGPYELFAVHDVLHNTLNVLDQCLLLRSHCNCRELSAMLERQYAFLCDEYNMLVQCFATGQDPEHYTKRYMMRLTNKTSLQPAEQSNVPIRRPCFARYCFRSSYCYLYAGDVEVFGNL
jgi:hypothetical protein